MKMKSIGLYFFLTMVMICGLCVDVDAHLQPDPACASLSCINKFSRTLYATCPVGYVVTGCSCGYACGSYSIQHVSANRQRCYCHSGCNPRPDWTNARCCQLLINSD
ncbi:resistin-like beta [Glandiceps talaboti]